MDRQQHQSLLGEILPLSSLAVPHNDHLLRPLMDLVFIAARQLSTDVRHQALLPRISDNLSPWKFHQVRLKQKNNRWIHWHLDRYFDWAFECCRPHVLLSFSTQIVQRLSTEDGRRTRGGFGAFITTNPIRHSHSQSLFKTNVTDMIFLKLKGRRSENLSFWHDAT